MAIVAGLFMTFEQAFTRAREKFVACTVTNLCIALSFGTSANGLDSMANARDEWATAVNEGELLLAQKQYKQAEPELLHSMAMSFACGSPGGSTISELLLGDYYFSKGDYKNTERFYQMASISPLPLDAMRGLKSLTIFYVRLGKKEQAVQCNNLMKNIEDKLAKEEHINKQHPANYGPYFEKMSSRIKRYWSPPAAQKNNVAVAKFRLERNGSISLLHISHSSGVKEADEAALKALERATPLPAPEPPFPRPMDMQYTFDPVKATLSVNPLKRNVPVKITRIGNVDVIDWPATEQAIQDTIAKVEQAKPHSPQVVADLLMQLGDCYFEQQNNTDAAETYEKALKVSEDASLPEKQVLNCHKKLAETYGNESKFDDSDKQWRKGMSLVNASEKLDKQTKIDYLSAYAKYLYVSSQTRDANAIYAQIRELQKDGKK
jgi:TonB family protein